MEKLIWRIFHSVLANLEQPLEDGGWKTVKSRIRSKYSPAALKNKTNNVLNSSSNHQHSNSISIKVKNSGTKTAEAAASNNLTDSDEDSEIVKKDEAIAKVEQEEKSLQREIRETEKSEMPLGKKYKYKKPKIYRTSFGYFDRSFHQANANILFLKSVCI